MQKKLLVIATLSLLSIGMVIGPALRPVTAYLTPDPSEPYGAQANAGFYSGGPYDLEGGAGDLVASASVTTQQATANGFASANLHSIEATLSGRADIAGGYFYDTYTIQSTTLPVGSPAHVVITYDIEGQLTGSGSMVYYIYSGDPGQAGLTQEASDVVGAGTLDTGTQAMNFDKSVGDSIVIEVDLSCYTVNGDCQVNDPLTATSDTPGVSVVSAAELAAQPPPIGAPEFGVNGMLLMLGLGLAVVLAVRTSFARRDLTLGKPA